MVMMILKKYISLLVVAVLLSACTQQEIYQNSQVKEAKIFLDITY